MFGYLTKQIVVPLILRAGLAVIFVFHGLGKINEATSWGTNWHPEMPTPVQVSVAYGELLGGIALGLGFLTRLAALGIIAIMVGAVATVTLAKGFDSRQGGFEYNFALIIMCLAVVLLGPGPLSFDRFMLGPRQKTGSPQVLPAARQGRG